MQDEQLYSFLIDYFRKNRAKPLDRSETISRFHGFETKTEEFLNSLQNSGVLIRVKKGRLMMPHGVDVIIGRLSLHRNGFGFVCPPSGQDIFIPPRFIRDTMDGDTVLAGVVQRHKRKEGWIIQVLRRNSRRIVARYETRDGFGRGIPLDEKANYEILLDKSQHTKLKDRQIILIELASFPGRHRYPFGRVVKTLGEQGTYEVDLMTVFYKYNIAFQFRKETLEEADRLPDFIEEEELKKRKDLRNLPFVTIDGEDAKDFDDAVFVAPLSKSSKLLLVSIADVAHYVKENSALDSEASERGTSIYFPGRAVPMLPAKLSNNLASLNPGVDRLVMTVEMEIDRNGAVRRSDIYPAVIRSRARMTYTDVWSVLNGDRNSRAKFKALTDMFDNMFVLRNWLKEMRERRGSLNFDLPEPQVIIDFNGNPVDVRRAERNPAHSIIEEFMIAANETVARTLEKAEIPLLYRIHEIPDAQEMHSLRRFLSGLHFSFKIDRGVTPQKLQTVIEKSRGTPYEQVINTMILRSLKQARYSPKNMGHFGLASDCYCHFTSPIRRYPDLIVHRILKQYLSGEISSKKIQKLKDELPYIGDNSSDRERIAIEAERDMVDRLRTRFMINRIGEEYSGRIAMVKDYGIIVELDDFFVEGMVPVSTLFDDYYKYDENTLSLVGVRKKRSFRIGDSLKVMVSNVNLDFGRVEFMLPNGQERGKRCRRE